MNIDKLVQLACEDRLYPAIIIHGSDLGERRQAALELSRALLCEPRTGPRPCSGTDCRHCSRLTLDPEDERFHPDIHALRRDLRTATSVDATRKMLSTANRSPFEARGQVFIIDEAQTLSESAADALLKILEEPPLDSPRHFFLLAPSRRNLSPTLRSRALSVYLPSDIALDRSEVEDLAASFRAGLEPLLSSGAAVGVIAAAGALASIEGWRDPRARKPWAVASAAVVEACYDPTFPEERRPALLAFAAALLDAPQMRSRAISPQRLLEGLLSLHMFEPANRHRRWWSFSG